MWKEEKESVDERKSVCVCVVIGNRNSWRMSWKSRNMNCWRVSKSMTAGGGGDDVCVCGCMNGCEYACGGGRVPVC